MTVQIADAVLSTCTFLFSLCQTQSKREGSFRVYHYMDNWFVFLNQRSMFRILGERRSTHIEKKAGDSSL